MAHTAPGKAYREGLTLMDLFAMFPDDASATKWFEAQLWSGGRCCGKCGSTRTREANHKTMPYWCTDCRSYFSIRTGTPLARSNVPLQKWALAIYLCLTSLKSVSSMKLHRDIGVTQSTAWFMLHRIREAWMPRLGKGGGGGGTYEGPVEVDETYMGGKRKNMSNAKRKSLANTGRGAVGKTAVVGVKDRATKQVRAKVVVSTDKPTLQRFVYEHARPGATVYSDEAAVYEGMHFHHETVRHSVSEYVRGMAHTNGVESFWSRLKRSHQGTFHKLSPKHLNRYVQEFAAKHNIRESGTRDQMRDIVLRLIRRDLPYRKLVAPNGLPSGARSADSS